MSPVTVLVPNNIAGIVARRFLAHGLAPERRGIAAIRFTTLRHLAEQLAGPVLAGAGRRPATAALTAAAVRACLDADPGVFEPVAQHPATARALARSHRALRDVDADALPHLVGVSVARRRRRPPAPGHPRPAPRRLLRQRPTSCTPRPACCARERQRTDELGTLVLYLPQDLDRAETGMLRALADTSPPCTSSPRLTGEARADAAVLDAVSAAGATPPASDHRAHQPTAHRVLTASDADDEVRCVVREVVAALREHPAHRLAVLYSNASPYARLLHEHLAAADVTVNGAGVRPVAERATARFLLGLLETARTGFRRADVMRTLGEVPLTTFAGERVSVARFERASREAGVVGGADWQAKLEGYVERLERAAETAEYESSRAHARRSAQAGEQLLAFVTELQRRLDARRRGRQLARPRPVGPRAARRRPHRGAPAAAAPRGAVRPRRRSSASSPGSPPSTPRASPRPCSASRRCSASSSSRPSPGSAASARACSSRRSRRPSGSTSTRSGSSGSPRTSTPAGSTRTPSSPNGCARHPTVSSRRPAPRSTRSTASSSPPSTSRPGSRRASRAATCGAAASASRAGGSSPPCGTSAATRTSRRRSGPRGSTPREGWLHSSPSFAASVLTAEQPSTRQEWAMRQASATPRLGRPGRRRGPRARSRPARSERFTRFDGNLAGADGAPRLRDRRAPRLPHLARAVRHLPARVVRPADAVRRAGRVARGGRRRSARSTSATSSTSPSTGSSPRRPSAASCPATASRGPRPSGSGSGRSARRQPTATPPRGRSATPGSGRSSACAS